MSPELTTVLDLAPQYAKNLHSLIAVWDYSPEIWARILSSPYSERRHVEVTCASENFNGSLVEWDMLRTDY